ncbi:MAG: 50S ribosomal protein L23 [Thermoplasmata archaeon]
MNPYSIILRPFVTEKALFAIEKDNKITFIVKRNATKIEIKEAFEKMFNMKIKKINTMITRNGKKAMITLAPEHNAGELATRLGIF